MKKFLGLTLTLGVLGVALAAPWLATSDPLTTDFASGLRPRPAGARAACGCCASSASPC